jgi:uncharacterized membrane protein
MALAPWQAAVLVGWSTAAAVIVGWTVAVVSRSDADATARIAMAEDDTRGESHVLLVVSAVASLAAIGVALIKAAHAKGSSEGLMTGLAVLTVVLSWAVVQSVYVLHYAHLFYSEGGGIDFNEDDRPDYRDFAYLALTLGMTYQVSDTDLTSKSMRRTATRHALLSYLFGAVVIAMAINVVAGLLNK